MLSESHLPAKLVSPFQPVAVDLQINPQRNHGKLAGCADAKRFMNLAALLFGDDYDAVGYQPRQRPFNRQEEAGLRCPVIAVKNMPMIGVHKTAGSGFAN